MTAPYTPETLQTIRRMAAAVPPADIARALQWDVAFLKTVARRHQIEMAVLLGNDGPRAPIVRNGAPPPPAPLPAPKPVAALRWDSRTRELGRNDHLVTLSEPQAQLFGLLLAQHRADRTSFVSSPQIAERLTFWQVRNGHLMRQLRARLAPLGIGVETKVGPGGGYRLKIEEEE